MIYSKTGRLYDLKVTLGYIASLDKWIPADNAIYYFHAYYDLHHGIKILDCLEEKQWEHLRIDPSAKFLYENCNETFTYTLAHDLKNIIEQKQIPAEKIYLIVMDEVHKKFLKDRLTELNIVGITIGVYNDLLGKTHIPQGKFSTEKKFSALSRNYRSWRLQVYAEMVKRDILKNFNYSFYNIFPYGEVKYYSQETMLTDLSNNGFEVNTTVTNWLSKVPYTLDDPADVVTNKWNNATYNCVLSADFHLLIETHYDLSYYVPGFKEYQGENPRNLAPSSITEKTNKPIACARPFIVFSTPYFLEDVRQLGFETFSPYINESYDLETDNYKRLNMIVDEIERITNLSVDEYNILVENCHSIAVRNQQKLLFKKDNLQYNEKFNFLRDYFEPQSNIQIL
jgi:hypothetical protein